MHILVKDQDHCVEGEVNVLMAYGRKMPLRIIEDIRYWKSLEKEHTLLIRELVPQLPQAYQQLMKEWHNVFEHAEQTAQQTIQQQLRRADETQDQLVAAEQSYAAVASSLEQSKEFTNHLYRMIEQVQEINKNPAARVVMAHIARQSEYFIGVMEALDQMKGQINADSERVPDEPPQLSVASLRSAAIPDQPVPIGGHRLPPLPYAYDALEPYIDEKTMRLHHDEHHKSYVEGLNQAEKKMAEARQKNDFALIKHWEREAAFHGAGHYLHTIFWHIMSPQGGGKANGAIAAQIKNDFGSYEAFKQHFSAAAKNVEGSGWAILVWSPRSHRLEILQAEKHQNLSQWDVIPLLVLDVWEHSYYLKYPNERAAYIDAWWNVVNWDHVNERFAQARRVKWMPY